MSASRYTTPALAAAAVLGGALYVRSRSSASNADPAQQVADNRPKTAQPKSSSSGLSGIIQGAAQVGGTSARSGGPEADPKDTRVASAHDSTPTKRGPSGQKHHHDDKQPGLESRGA